MENMAVVFYAAAIFWGNFFDISKGKYENSLNRQNKENNMEFGAYYKNTFRILLKILQY